MPNRSRSLRQLAAAAAAAAAMTCIAASAQTSSDMPITRVVTLGTQGGPLATGRRSQPANAVVVGDRVYLVDAGNGVLRQLVAAKLDYRRIDHVFITHNHSDHNADWGTLIGLQWTTGRSTPVTVHGPTGTRDMLQGYLAYMAPHAQLWSAAMPSRPPPKALFAGHDIDNDGLVFEDDRVKVTAAAACHFHFASRSFPAEKVPKSFAYRFQTHDKVIVFSGDTGPCSALIDFAQGADLLVHEVVSLPLIAESLRKVLASRPGGADPALFDNLMHHMAEDHTSPEEVGKLAQAAGVKKVVLTHFTPGADADPEGAYVDGVRKHFSGPVVAAEDLAEF